MCLRWGPVVWSSDAWVAIGRVGVAIHIGVVPETIGREHRYIRQIANAIVRISEGTLPHRFLPAAARAVGTGDYICSRCAIARSSAASTGVEDVAADRTGTEAVRAIRRRV